MILPASSTLSEIAALRTPIASNKALFPVPLAPINTFTLPGSNVILDKDLKFFIVIATSIMAPRFANLLIILPAQPIAYPYR
jgi:hypothetical protein